MNLIDYETHELTKEILDYCLINLKELLILSIKMSILSYKKETKNLIKCIRGNICFRVSYSLGGYLGNHPAIIIYMYHYQTTTNNNSKPHL